MAKVPFSRLPRAAQDAYIAQARREVYVGLEPATPEKEAQVKARARSIHREDEARAITG